MPFSHGVARDVMISRYVDVMRNHHDMGTLIIIRHHWSSKIDHHLSDGELNIVNSEYDDAIRRLNKK